jgi:4'-phosphopantetheinyl transferase
MQKITPCNATKFNLLNSAIDIWHIPLYGSTLDQDLMALLSNDERQRQQRFYFDKHKRRFLYAHSAMRLILANYLNTKACALEFKVYSHGKPYLDCSAIEFNLSHSKDKALLAVGLNYAMGIDIEFFSDRDFIGLAKHSFSDQEQKALTSCNEEELRSCFFHIWSQKEAFIKALGLGLSYPTSRFSVSVHPPAMLLKAEQNLINEWQLMSFKPDDNSWGSLCYNPQVKEVNHFAFNHIEFLS